MSSTRFDPPVPTLEEITGISDTTVPDSNGIIVPDENDYSSSSNKRTLRSYISSLTKGTIPTENIVEYNGPLPPPHANPFPLEPSGEEAKFTDQDGLRDAVDRDSAPSLLFGDTSSIIKPNALGEANDSVELSGHELLAGMVGSSISDGEVAVTTAGAAAYAATLGQALSSKNLNSGKLTVKYGSTTSEAADRSFTAEDAPTTTARVLMGDTLVDGNLSRSYDVQATAGRVKPEDLRSVALKMVRKATGADEDGKGGVNAKLGKKTIDAHRTRAATIASFENLNRTTLAQGRNDLESGEEDAGSSSYTQTSWPVLHTPDEPYTGLGSTSDAFTAFVTSGEFLAAVLVTSALGSVFPVIAKGLVPAEINTGGTDSNRKLKSGKFRYVEEMPLAGLSTLTEIASNVTGLNVSIPIYSPTNPLSDYPSCVIAGLASFLGVSYGIDPSFKSLGFIDTNVAIITSEIAVRVLAIFADPASRQYYMNIIRELNRDTVALGGELNMVSAGSALGAISSIFDSKLFKFVNTLAQVGDLIYTQAAAIDHRKTDMELEPQIAYSSFNPDDSSGLQKALMRGFGSRRIYGNRLVGRRGVSYSLADLPSYHLIPSGSTQIYRSVLGDASVASRIKSSPTAESVDGRLRFTPSQVSAIESTLEAEYMPFYFQDLRTNEIISFHAFLEDLSDSYTANYNNAGGYGRIEEIKTYKDTKRSVGFSFHIVATNPQDFDYMWWQINKLTTMVYPQWSSGRNLIGKVDDEDFKFTQPFSQIPTATPVVRVRIGDLIRSNYSRFNLKRLFGYQNNDFGQSSSSLEGVTSSIIIKPGTYYTVDPVLGTSDGSTVTLKEEKTKGFGSIDPKTGVANVLVPEGNILVDPKDYVPATYLNYDKNSSVREFYDSENNSIVKSFETTRGLGLAGVVTQLQFTWMDASILWGAGDDGPGNRAPRACKVQVSFDPIHDIAPGLDSDGFNRAPIYPVGGLVNSIVEGGEAEPYGVGTTQRSQERAEIAATKSEYEDLNKQTILQKLF